MKNIIQYDTTRNVEKIFTIKDEYYKLISSTLQNSCHNLKRIAGRWSNSCGFFDGEKLGMISLKTSIIAILGQNGQNI